MSFIFVVLPLVTGTLVTSLCHFLESDYIFHYIQGNVIGIQVTLLSINTATLGLIASKIQEISLQYNIDFTDTVREMKFSLKEQIALIITSIATLIIMKSKLLTMGCQEFVGNAILSSVVIYALNILWDTGKSVFVIIELINDSKDNE